MEFIKWLELMCCLVEIEQEDDGSGYTVIMVTVPIFGNKVRITVDS